MFLAEGRALSQSLAIIEYLDETHREPPLLPSKPIDRAYVRSLALSVSCDIHPLNNLRVLNYLKDSLNIDEKTRQEWYAHWTALGLSAIEEKLTKSDDTGVFCFGDQPTLADICLIPQVFNAKRMGCVVERMGCVVDAYPEIERIAASCARLSAFQAAEPSNQPDAE